ncbi:ATP-binding protein [Kineosporia sp. NBRC 101731]|uniref:ATP-binding protein n=1 Tax=Kineosporia sp. NBRC 101731 TaxID=3032199 RepID=UPI0024A0A351|nr:ATP-binding protein [Kineosporia sp. NBRC 101731]GLY31793.1 hypothetical protein Kisp02_51580 [Kineosporia sp. NBRC 101731]
MSAAVLTQARPPAGFWAQRLDWEIDSFDGSVEARTQARDAVAAAGGSGHASHPSGHVFSAASERVAMTMGELTVNGLRHGGPPVTASLSRGPQGWLLVVADKAADRVPVPPGADLTAVGGLGLRLVISMSVEVGWCVEKDRKLVWALVGDMPSPSLMHRLDQATS